LIARGIRSEFGVSGESTDLAVYLGHRGKARFDVTVSGRASHASTPEAGLNAVQRAVPFLKALEKAGRGLGSDPLLGRATITVTGISSEPDSDVAVVPSSCTIRVDRRYLPLESAESCLTELRTLVANVSRSESIDATVELLDDYPLMAIDRSHALVQAGTDAVAAITGREARVGAWRFGVNATFMSAAGIPCIGMGPGNEDWAHTSDEHVPVAQLVDSSRIYAELLARLAGASGQDVPAV
jgi:succinyl-diaminopimelate desuccinylase